MWFGNGGSNSSLWNASSSESFIEWKDAGFQPLLWCCCCSSSWCVVAVVLVVDVVLVGEGWISEVEGIEEVVELFREKLCVKFDSEEDIRRIDFFNLSMMVTARFTSSSVTSTALYRVGSASLHQIVGSSKSSITHGWCFACSNVILSCGSLASSFSSRSTRLSGVSCGNSSGAVGIMSNSSNSVDAVNGHWP